MYQLISLTVLSVCLPLSAVAFDVPALRGPVMDNGNMFSASAEQSAESLIRSIHSRGGAQLQVYSVPDMAGLTIEQAAIQVVDKWKLGTKEADRGVLLMFAKKERKMRIEVGQGLEGELTDLTSKRIIDQIITPSFKAGDFDRGLLDGVSAIFEKTDPTLVSSTTKPRPRFKRRGKSKLAGYFDLFFIAIFLLVTIFGRRRGHWYGGGGGWSGGGGGWSGGGGGFSGGGASGGW